MVEQRSPKPSIWVRILVLLPFDFTEYDDRWRNMTIVKTRMKP